MSLVFETWIPLFTQHLESLLVRNSSSETRHICFPSPSKIDLIGVVKSKKYSSQPGDMWVSRMPTMSSFLSLSLSRSLHSDQTGLSAVLCWHNEYGDTKNTDAQMEHAALHTFVTYGMFLYGCWCCCCPMKQERKEHISLWFWLKVRSVS